MRSSQHGTADSTTARPAGRTARSLPGDSVPARIRPWPFDPSVAHLVVYRSLLTPADSDVAAWVGALRSQYRTVRTGAMMPAAAAPFLRNGFVVAQRLVLLEHHAPSAVATPARPHLVGRGPTRRLRGHDLGPAAAVDRAAFEQPWQLDAAGIDDACRATSHHRARLVRVDGDVVAYAVSGRDGADGYLQRLAVHPHHHGRGHGTHLVEDALHWAGAHGARRMLVNTHVGNDRALQLYHRLGFTDREEQLVVLERPL